MIARAVKKKLRGVFTVMIVVCMFLQSATPALAYDNGKPVTAQTHVTSNPNYLSSMRYNLAIMLCSGSYGEFVLDRNELTASVVPQKGIGHITQAYADEQNDAYTNMSITKAQAQIFKCTQVAWNAPSAKESLILMGPDVFWHETGPGGVTYSAEGQASIKDFYLQHRITYDPYNMERHLYKYELKESWYSAYGDINTIIVNSYTKFCYFL